MTPQQTDATTDPQSIIAALRAERDAALAREAALAEALTTRNSEYGERIEQQSATIDVLKVMSASPGDPLPVFDLIANRARAFCEADGAMVTLLEDGMLHLRTHIGATQTASAAYEAYFPCPVDDSTTLGRAVLTRASVHNPNLLVDPGYRMKALTSVNSVRSNAAVPILRGGVPIGAIGINWLSVGEFPTAQLELLKTFAEQAVIAITSAETYRALQTRTADLQESLEYQTATSDVLKVISRSTFDLQPVLDTVAQTAARLCDADQAAIYRREGESARLVANFGFPPEYENYTRALGAFPIDPNAAAVGQRTLVEGRPVHVHDVAAVPGYWEIAVNLGKQRTSLGVPLLRDRETIGNIMLARQRVEPFTDRQIELVSTFADQAVIAIENTRLITEQREALEQQTATAEVLQVINASRGKLEPVFDVILEKAMRLCDAAFGMFFAYDGTSFRTMVTRGVPAAYAAFRARQPPIPTPGSPFGRAFETRRPVHVFDWLEDPDYKGGTPGGRVIADLGGARTVLNVPLVKDTAVLGMISFYRQQVRPFSDKQIALLENFAAQAVIAMENARLITEQREALEQQTATAEVLQVINSSPGDLKPVFDAMLEKAMRLCGAAFGSLYTYDGEQFHSAAQRGVPAAFAVFRAENPPLPTPGGGPATLLETRRTLHVLDIKAHESYRPDNSGVRAMVELGGVRTILSVPLIRDDETFFGYISIFRQEVRAFSDKQIALLESFAAQAVIAMENARLITEQREALEQQTATAEVLAVINAHPGDLGPVFDMILEKAHRLCDVAMGALLICEAGQRRAVATRGYSPEADAHARRLRPIPNNLTTLAKSGAVLHHPDVSGADSPLSGAFGRTFIALTGARTYLVVPLSRDGTLLGTITAVRREVRPFTERQVTLLKSFAAHAVIAMENARLLTEQQEALEQQTATAEVLQVINASPGDLAPVFDAMLEKAMRLCEAAFGELYGFDGEGFPSLALKNVPAAYAASRTAGPVKPIPGSFGARFIAGEYVIHIPDLKEEDAYRSGNAVRRAMVDLGGARTAIAVALHVDDQIRGALIVYRQEVRPFSGKQIALLENFAAQAVIAMENARLLDEIRQRQEELRVTFENMGDGVAMFDETQHLVAWNRKFQDILDVPDDIIVRRQTFSEYIRYLAERGEYGHEANAEQHVRRLIEQAGQARTYERTRPDGRVIEIRQNPVPSGGFVLIYADITERKRSEAEIRAARDAAEEASRTIEAAFRDLKAAQANLIQAEKMASLGQLTAGIAHEIKNPLNFVNNFAALSVDLLSELKETAAPGFAALTDDQRVEIDDVSAMLTSNLEKITEHGKRADGIVKAMLEHSRGSSAERRMIDLNALIDEALNLAYHGARAQDQSFNITLERDFGEGIAQIEVNPQDMTRVFLNIFSNGFYAATKGARNSGDAGFVPTLKVTTRDAGEVVEFRVRDNGTGIPAEIRDKLFQPFFTTKPTGEGTGLGLSITYDIVTKQHGGTIAVDSEVNEFTEFVVTLPRQMFANGDRA